MILVVADGRRTTGDQVRAVAQRPRVREKLIGGVLDNVGRPLQVAEAAHLELTGQPGAKARAIAQTENGRYIGRVSSVDPAKPVEPTGVSKGADPASHN
jgi:hypothetical protein